MELNLVFVIIIDVVVTVVSYVLIINDIIVELLTLIYPIITLIIISNVIAIFIIIQVMVMGFVGLRNLLLYFDYFLINFSNRFISMNYQQK